MTFDGWALVGRRMAATVDVVLNEMTTVHASLGSARPDVPVSLSEPTAIACGWTAKIDLAQWPLGDLRVKVIATSRSGMSSVIGHRMYTLIGEGFEGYLDTPPEGAEVLGDLLIVQGWATVGQRPASRIDIHLNGRYAGRARLRVVRSDVERHGAGRLGPYGFRISRRADSQRCRPPGDCHHRACSRWHHGRRASAPRPSRC